jgi:hypothetical protein
LAFGHRLAGLFLGGDQGGGALAGVGVVGGEVMACVSMDLTRVVAALEMMASHESLAQYVSRFCCILD